MAKKVLIRKETGEFESFDQEKLAESLKRSGAQDKNIDLVIRQVRKELPTGSDTSDIYREAYGVLRKIEKPAAMRYSLKRAVLDLGPAGFSFEDFVGEIFKAKGFTVDTSLTMQGSCVEHEVDIYAYNNVKCLVGEVKFHNDLSMKSDLKVALYVQSRVEDLQKNRIERGERKIDEGWIITNTKFTKAAVQYANCKGLKILSWSYPRFGNLQDLIEETHIHPITALPSLSRMEKNLLLQKKIVLCKTMKENESALKSIGVNGQKLERILEESRMLCETNL